MTATLDAMGASVTTLSFSNSETLFYARIGIRPLSFKKVTRKPATKAKKPKQANKKAAEKKVGGWLRGTLKPHP